jgi:translation elongation factor EF-G
LPESPARTKLVRVRQTSALAFEIAARGAVKEGLAKAAPKLLEPV